VQLIARALTSTGCAVCCASRTAPQAPVPPYHRPPFLRTHGPEALPRAEPSQSALGEDLGACERIMG